MISSVMGVFSSAISLLRVRIRRARERMAILVAVCSLREPEVGWPGRNLLVLVTGAAVVRPSELVSEIHGRGYY